MFQMLTCCNLKPGVELAEFERRLAEFTAHMVGLGLCEGCGPVGRRQADSGLDTDAERTHEFFFLMDFRDRAQADASLAHIHEMGQRNVPTHLEVFRRVTDSIFICWDQDSRDHDPADHDSGDHGASKAAYGAPTGRPD